MSASIRPRLRNGKAALLQVVRDSATVFLVSQ